MIKQKIFSFLKNKRCTLLGVGPMSVNCVDTVIELSNELDIPIFLIASRRQIDSEDFGGGYVNSWSTNNFSNYVFERDKKGKVILARDHGGPWQNPKEIEQSLSLKKAMESAKESYLADIKAGFDILHLDPSIDIHRTPTVDDILDRLLELYEYCWSQANKLNKDITFEIGTEEQSGSTHSQEELDYVLQSVKDFCRINNIPTPTFVVIQAGTKVLETRNVGSFDSPIRIKDEIPAEIQIPRMLEICKKNNILMKAHNADYLSDIALSWHPRLGIPAINVAPEFGVTESIGLIEILEKNNLVNEAEEFLKLSYESMKWEKWLAPNSNTNDRQKSIISGHYIFSDPIFLELKNKCKVALLEKGISLDEFLKSKIKESIMRYVKNLRLVSK